ncbi:acyl-CoA dehydrogenase family protein [Dactylosporangium sp. CA-092794]|uniref:acyl-CoA dehydrogenase family protein n=1 Tax=Dactylosporangium sp. CA-092794 TaxID=3239929 RepID=UPI003D8C1F10
MSGPPGIQFVPTMLTPAEQRLQAEVRAFLAEELGGPGYRPGLGMNGAADGDFSRKLGARGWLGMALPKRFGGGERSAVDRFVVTAELLRRGAPVGHHWLADRQSGPMINRFGTAEQKRRYLPGICAGELSFSIGMSEPDVGSDLAAVRTRAVRDGDGWLINGTKVWTTGAHRSDYMVTLCRTSDEPDRHAGLSQFIVDLHQPGVAVRGIQLLDGTTDFNEVVLTDVRVGDDMLLGMPGQGWEQNTAELAFERGGPDRFLSTYPVFEAFLRETDPAALDQRAHRALGRLVATYWVLYGLTLSVARAVDRGESPVHQAALVKEFGTRFEQDVVTTLLDITGIAPVTDAASVFERILCEAILTGPVLTIRGGTIEILRSVAAKGLLG